MVKIEALDLELVKIGWQRFNPRGVLNTTQNATKWGIDLIIHKYPNDWRPHKLRSIIFFDIKANMQNKHLGINATIQAKNLDGLAPRKMVSGN